MILLLRTPTMPGFPAQEWTGGVVDMPAVPQHRTRPSHTANLSPSFLNRPILGSHRARQCPGQHDCALGLEKWPPSIFIPSECLRPARRPVGIPSTTVARPHLHCQLIDPMTNEQPGGLRALCLHLLCMLQHGRSGPRAFAAFSATQLRASHMALRTIRR